MMTFFQEKAVSLKMNKRIPALICALTAVFVCLLLFVKSDNKTPPENNGAFFTFTDSLGNEVVLTKKPEKTAVLFSSLCNVWKNAGGKTYITVGESVERGFCGEDVLLVDSGAGKSINTELLISYKPDFVIYSSDIPAQKECSALLSKAGIPSAAIKLDSFEDYLDALKIFCALTENEQLYNVFGENIKEKIEHRKKQASLIKEAPVILFVRSGSGQSSCKAKKSQDNFAAKILEELGCINIADKAPLLLDGLSAEEVLSAKPDFIFVSLMGDEEAAENYTRMLFSSEPWNSLDSTIVYLPKDLFHHKPCENWNLAYDYLAEILYPWLFAK